MFNDVHNGRSSDVNPFTGRRARALRHPKIGRMD
jgi:hypothetical protein